MEHYDETDFKTRKGVPVLIRKKDGRYGILKNSRFRLLCKHFKESYRCIECKKTKIPIKKSKSKRIHLKFKDTESGYFCDIKLTPLEEEEEEEISEDEQEQDEMFHFFFKDNTNNENKV